MNFKEIHTIIGGKLILQSNRKESITELSIDSRRIVAASATLFFAIAGEQRSGIQFVKDAYLKGVRNFVIHEKIDLSFMHQAANVVLVKDSVAALQKLGTYIRQQFQLPVIAITGSNGKTIVKEWLSKILSGTAPFNEKAGIVKSPKSFNSQIGVPLSLWQIQAEHTIGVFEAGISKVGEMAHLEAMIQPSIGILTNIGDAHSEFFSSKEEKLQEKLKLFYHSDYLVVSLDINHIKEGLDILKKKNKNLKRFTWSYEDEQADLYIFSKRIKRQQCSLQYYYLGKKYTVHIPFTQDAYVQNAINVIATLLLLGVDFETIKEGIAQLKAVAMRLEVRDAVNDCFLIADTYNSDLSSLKAGLEFLSQQMHKKKTLILSDMQESGKDKTKQAAAIASLLKEYKVGKFIAIGAELNAHQALFLENKKMETHFFETTELFLKQYHPSFFEKEYILLKGARKFAFERIQNRLELQLHNTILEVNLEAIAHNLKAYKKCIKPSTKLMAMVKAYSYGSGSVEVAQKLQYEGVDYLTVAYTDEGIELRNSGISLPIMVMSPEIHSFESMIRWRLEPEIFNIHSLQLFIQAANAQQEMHYPIHLKLDTGMHRLGFEEQDLEMMLYLLHNTETVKVASIFSHLAGSDELRLNTFTAKQNKIFDKMSGMIMQQLAYKPLLHIANSAGIVNHPELQKDMVRLGIGLYGIDSSKHMQQKLQNVSTLKSYIVQIRNVAKTETVGYSRKGKLKRDSKIATVAIGYADGYFRSFGNGVGYMLVHNKKARIVGNVCMDMCMLDVTDIKDVQEGDEVIVFGKELPVSTLAAWGQTISYEVLTSISRRVNRVYVNE